MALTFLISAEPKLDSHGKLIDVFGVVHEENGMARVLRRRALTDWSTDGASICKKN
jgi:hypothetical protein